MADQERFLTLFMQSQAMIKAFVLAMVRDRDLCDDIMQEVALILWKQFDRFDVSRSFGAWARGIAANTVLKTWRQNRRAPVLLSDEAVLEVLEAYDATEPERGSEKKALSQCIAELPERSRQLLALRYERAMQLKDLAREIGSTFHAVNKSLSRVRQALARCIEKRLARIRGA